MNILFSFLGKTRGANGYAHSVYRFDDGQEIETSFFGLGLARKSPPDHFVLLGTPGSMWDVLLAHQAPGFDQHQACLRLLEAAESQTVSEDLLQEMKPLIEASVGCPVTLAIIPMGRDETEQTGILRRMADLVHEGDAVTLDVTHSLRHLPMLGLAAMYYLGYVRRARIQEILYGAHEMSGPDRVAPVIRLSGLLRVMEWVQALAAYDKDGDYGAFAPLLLPEGLSGSAAERLRRAAFQERINDIVPARQTLVPLLKDFDHLDSPLARLFVPELRSRLDWVKMQHRDEWELRLGDAYLERGDYLRASIHFLEGRISRELRGNEQAHTRNMRENAESVLNVYPEFGQLHAARNCMAHGVRKDQAVLRHMRDDATLRSALARFREKLFGPRSSRSIEKVKESSSTV